jgi:signal transduction histidine kinase
MATVITARQEALREVSRYNTVWFVSQALAEFTRLQQRISAFGDPNSNVDKDEVELRFDILLNRIALLNDGEFQVFLSERPEHRTTVDQLGAAAAAAAPLVSQIDSPGSAERLSSILSPFESKLTALAAAALRYGADRVSEDQRELLRLHLTFSFLSAAFVVFGLSLIVVLFRQNTVLERARTEVSQQNTRFDIAINNMPHGLAMFDPEMRMIVGNRRLPDMLGQAADTPVTGMTLAEVADEAEVRGHANQAAALRSLAAALVGDTADAILHQLPDGRTLAVSRSVMAEGGFVCIFEDVTARIKAQMQREQLEEQLRQAQKMEAVGQLTGGIAHDFNNLLTVILGNAELIAENSNDQSVQELARMSLEAAERGADLTHKLLAFSRRQTLTPDRLSVADTVQQLEPLLRRAIGETINLRVNVPAEPHWAWADRSSLESAILNLAVNARDAMPQGGTLTITAGERIAGYGEGLFTAGQRIVFVVVSDTGSGMSPEIRERVFEPFFTTKEVGKGTGLGLSMVYGFAQQSGGHVSIESEMGRGTAVTILLPAVTNTSAEPNSQDVAPLAVPNGREKVLVVEDEPQVLTFVSSQLESLGYDVTAVASGPEALKALEGGRTFDLLFTDVVLPHGMSGVELAQRVRAMGLNTKVLLTSGYAEEVFAQHGRPPADVLLLRKPYRRKELAETLRSVLEKAA